MCFGCCLDEGVSESLFIDSTFETLSLYEEVVLNVKGSIRMADESGCSCSLQLVMVCLYDDAADGLLG